MRHRILLIGLGDLAERIATHLAGTSSIELVLAGRHAGRGRSMARLVSSLGAAPARHAHADALDAAQVADLLATERPDVVVQCAALVSPWALAGRDDPPARAMRAAGFGLQLCAQPPCIASVMRAARDAGHRGPVVNCSYPDLTHPVLQALGDAPALGIGNAGMVQALARSALAPAAGPRPPRMRVLAHHFHVGAVAASDEALLRGLPAPRTFVDDTEVDARALLFGRAPLALDRRLNELTAAHAAQVIRAMLPGASPFQTSVPGPRGLAGGWPVLIQEGAVTLDLPRGVDAAEVAAAMSTAARGDGVQGVGTDGTVTFTDEAADRLWHACRELALPLPPADALARARVLQDFLRVPS